MIKKLLCRFMAIGLGAEWLSMDMLEEVSNATSKALLYLNKESCQFSLKHEFYLLTAWKYKPGAICTVAAFQPPRKE